MPAEPIIPSWDLFHTDMVKKFTEQRMKALRAQRKENESELQSETASMMGSNAGSFRKQKTIRSSHKVSGFRP